MNFTLKFYPNKRIAISYLNWLIKAILTTMTKGKEITVLQCYRHHEGKHDCNITALILVITPILKDSESHSRNSQKLRVLLSQWKCWDKEILL